MAKILVICGHGQGVYNYDVGCVHGQQTEADYVRRFASAMRKYDGGQIDYITDYNVFDYDSKIGGYFAGFAQSGYQAIIELHVDAAASPYAEDGHVIILDGYEPDDLDYRIKDVIAKHVGSNRGDWNHDGILDGIAGRDNLWNVNQASAYGLNYRLVELGFMSNNEERNYLYNNIDTYAKDMVAAILNNAPKEKNILWDMPIIGEQYLTSDVMAYYALKNNPNPQINCSMKELAQHFLDEGKIEGVRGDIAFCQSLHETGYFKYGNLVLKEQNNFAGIGATNNSGKGKGAWFDTPQLGVRAQIQHLKGYASTEPLQTECVDPRYDVLKSTGKFGKRTTWKSLSGSWAVPGYSTNKYSNLNDAIENSGDYGSTIIKTYIEIRKLMDVAETIEKVPDPNEPSDWAKDSWKNVTDAKLLDGTRPKDSVTRQELASILDRLMKKGVI